MVRAAAGRPRPADQRSARRAAAHRAAHRHHRPARPAGPAAGSPGGRRARVCVHHRSAAKAGRCLPPASAGHLRLSDRQRFLATGFPFPGRAAPSAAPAGSDRHRPERPGCAAHRRKRPVQRLLLRQPRRTARARRRGGLAALLCAVGGFHRRNGPHAHAGQRHREDHGPLRSRRTQLPGGAGGAGERTTGGGAAPFRRCAHRQQHQPGASAGQPSER